MFLFLSKLIPQFFYPLGATCVLMIVALFTLWKRPRWAAGAISLALALLLIGSNGWTTSWLTQNLEWQQIPQGELPNVDAIVVLGGATKSALPPRPGVDLNESGDRVVYGCQLFRQGKAPWLILSGGRVDWRHRGSAESEDMAVLSEFMGVPRSAILQDNSSFNTYQNAVNVQKILNDHGLRRILLVTSAMHMPRSLLIFKHLKIDAIPAPTDFQATWEDTKEKATFQGTTLGLVPDVGRLAQTTRALKEYLGLGVYRLRGWL